MSLLLNVQPESHHWKIGRVKPQLDPTASWSTDVLLLSWSNSSRECASQRRSSVAFSLSMLSDTGHTHHRHIPSASTSHQSEWLRFSSLVCINAGFCEPVWRTYFPVLFFYRIPETIPAPWLPPGHATASVRYRVTSVILLQENVHMLYMCFCVKKLTSSGESHRNLLNCTEERWERQKEPLMHVIRK